MPVDGPKKPRSSALAMVEAGALHPHRGKLVPRTTGHSRGKVVVDETSGFSLFVKGKRSSRARKAWL